ncbi:MAG: nitrous oxide reductase family maturation protein NosD, partial [Bacteroidetes bacterium]|nr:nitrous oxide reductase family maturation protein NosD [Bacteroidota bacterium]
MARFSKVKLFFLLLILCSQSFIYKAKSNTIRVGKNKKIKNIHYAILIAKPYDTIEVNNGLYKEGNIIINKSLYIKGINNPVLDGEKKFEILSIKANNTIVEGLTIKNSGYSTLDDPGAIKVYDATNVIIQNNILIDNFFGIYIQFGKNCIIRNNSLQAFGKEEQQIGNGIHCWKSDSLLILGNKITGHRDGIYFEFVTSSTIRGNISYQNIRYGLHFMFSNNDSYIGNIFKNNGAGVAVMFTHKVKMYNNYFINNWGDAAYGLLLKEISDSYIVNNHFVSNTIGIFMEGTSRINVKNNDFKNNGWGMKIQASCMDNNIHENNFINNTFDVSTNGSLVLNIFNKNYWDKFDGYDLDKNNIGDVPYHPLSLFSMIVENNGPVMLLYQSFFALLLDKSEKVIPSLTPTNFIDEKPL